MSNISCEIAVPQTVSPSDDLRENTLRLSIQSRQGAGYIEGVVKTVDGETEPMAEGDDNLGLVASERRALLLAVWAEHRHDADCLDAKEAFTFIVNLGSWIEARIPLPVAVRLLAAMEKGLAVNGHSHVPQP